VFWYGLGLLLICFGATLARAQTATLQATPEAPVQLVYPPNPGEQTGPPVTVTLADALQRAQKNNAEFLSALSDQKSAREDRLQARNARLPQVGFRSEYLGTQGNGKTPNGRYVTQDGVHVYREWATLHQDLTANVLMGTDTNGRWPQKPLQMPKRKSRGAD
jgi:outer membrane protein TolC